MGSRASLVWEKIGGRVDVTCLSTEMYLELAVPRRAGTYCAEGFLQLATKDVSWQA